MASKLDTLMLEATDQSYLLASSMARGPLFPKDFDHYSLLSIELKKKRREFFENIIQREFLSYEFKNDQRRKVEENREEGQNFGQIQEAKFYSGMRD